jgi:acyl transferase domain-containing protein/acyl carrier protein
MERKISSVNEILEWVKSRQITSEEGFDLIKKFKSKQADCNRESSAAGAGQTEARRRGEGGEDWQDIAVIGISGQFPETENVAEFWKHLSAGQDLIREIPVERWSVKNLLQRGFQEVAAGCFQRGGFLPGIDRFDPLFFNISPREAAIMDPQQRLFLQEAWKALEDAGYAAGALSGKACGVFVGCAPGDYNRRFSEKELTDAYSFSGNTSSILTARISYFLNLRGPSLAIDTACSSSLVATHLACESIRSGTCELAIAGGVMLMTTPFLYINFSKSGMLSPVGRCKTFDNEADGFVPGEGVGVVVLKPLARALTDNDHIYGIIKGSAINQDGKTNGITAPSAPSQTALECELYDKVRIHPETLSYIETHGTGTKLGDPIEIQALTAAFRKYTMAKQYCAVGSVKTNIGHTLGAAGVAGLIKVLLALKHKQLPPSINFNRANEHINFRESPFYVNTRLAEWSTRGNLPRRAAVSSFGFSGTNCHMIVEEAPARSDTDRPARPYYLITLSAKTMPALTQKARDLEEWLKGEDPPPALGDIAYTLHMGRSHFATRSALVVKNLEELAQKIRRIPGNDQEEGVITHPGEDRLSRPAPVFSQLGRELIQALQEPGGRTERTYREKLGALADLYTRGCDLEWEELDNGGANLRLSLPTYPFARERCWISGEEAATRQVGKEEGRLHPLVQRNISTLHEEKFVTHLTGQEFYLAQHVIGDQMVLPGVAYLEMVRAAGELAGEKPVRRIKNIAWLRPFGLTSASKEIYIHLYPRPGSDAVDFQVSSGSPSRQRVVHAQGQLTYGDQEDLAVKEESVDIEEIKRRCAGTVDSQTCYHRFGEKGLQLGPGFRVIRELFFNETEVLALLHLPPELKGDFNEYTLHPAMMDGALQSGIGLGTKEQANSSLYIPFSIGEVEIVASLPTEGWAHFKVSEAGQSVETGSRRCDVLLMDGAGKVKVKIKEFLARPLQQPVPQPVPVAGLYFRSVWREKALPEPGETSTGPIIIFDHHSDLGDALKECWNKYQPGGNDPGTRFFLVKPGPCYQVLGEHTYQINPCDQESYRQLFQELGLPGQDPLRIIHNWSHKSSAHPKDHEGNFEDQLDRGFYSLFHLSQVLMNCPEHKNKIRLLYLHPGVEEGPQPQDAAISGFARALRLENARFVYKTVEMGTAPGPAALMPAQMAEAIRKELTAETTDAAAVEISYREGQRLEKTWEAFDPGNETNEGKALKKQGVYLLTGGLGGLGMIVARFLAQEVGARLVLSGRSPLATAGKARLQDLEALGAEVIYVQADVSSQPEVRRLVQEAKSRFGPIAGIIHCAGVTRDALLLKKSRQDLEAVLAPKVYGAIYLDEATREENLDFFVFFSSTAAVTGNAGQCDYAYANSFMDYYAQGRENLRKKQERRGKTVSINWPLWQEGGMGVDRSTEEFLQRTLGVKLLETETGLEAFRGILAAAEPQVMVWAGETGKIKQFLRTAAGETQQEPTGADPAKHESQTGVEHFPRSRDLQQDIMKMVADISRVSLHRLSSSKNLAEYGFDSIGFVELTNSINSTFHLGITPALFFEYPSLSAFTGHLETEYTEQLARYYREQGRPSAGAVPGGEPHAAPAEIAARPRFREQEPAGRTRPGNEPVAVIGISGVMPQAENLELFWDHLEKGNDLVTKISRERAELGGYHELPDGEKNLDNLAWGGYMKEVDKFDALFFGISPREAELMDPQQRIFLETAWKAVEDAGYRVSDLAGTRTGVFVGVSTGDYSDIVKAATSTVEAHMTTGMSHCILANRISYLFGLHGPSQSLDTACSSALIALHQAVESIQGGSCEMAIVGGVNVLLTPGITLGFVKAGMLSPGGRCKTFDSSADGYVRGEGAGAVLLKPLAHALRDSDHIYAVIKATAINHGGHASSLTAPNPVAQADLLVEAYEKAGIDPSSVGYIEAHGTGTRLGDPVEINGLKRAFAQLYESRKQSPQKGYCGIGAVKTNIGHLEAAAGIAGLLKVLLALKHKTLPATLHFKELNPYIQLDDSPFYIISETRPWKQLYDSDNQPVPRRAGVSSFGFGGANAHVVLEEYEEPLFLPAPSPEDTHLIVLSAKNEERLKEYARELIRFLDRHPAAPAPQAQKPAQPAQPPGSALKLADMAYTLQVGRDAMEERMALVVSTIPELKEKLSRFCQEQDTPAAEQDKIFRSQGKGSQILLPSLLDGHEGREFFHTLVREKKMEKLAALWVSGVDIPWSLLYPGAIPRRMALPTYPFARERHWFVQPGTRFDNTAPGAVKPGEFTTIYPETFPSCIPNLLKQIPTTPKPGETPGATYLPTGSDTVSLPDRIQTFLIKTASLLLKVKNEDLDVDAELSEYGFDEITLMEFAGKIHQEYQLELTPSRFVEYPTLRLLANALAEAHGKVKKNGPGEDLRILNPGSEIVLQMKELEALLGRLMWVQLQSCGLFRERHGRLTELKAGVGLPELYDRWLEHSAAVLSRENYLQYDGESYTLTPGEPVAKEEVWKQWEHHKKTWGENPGMKAQVRLLDVTLRALPDILTGKSRATDVMFPNSSMELVEGIYKNNPVANYFNNLLATWAAMAIQERLKSDPTASLRILEIGAGTGGTSAMVLEKLQPYRAHLQEYCYTDISRAFLIYAEREYGPFHPYLSYQIFNVEKPIAEQNFKPGEYDIVIAANVLHATKNIRQTLRNSKALLKRNGLLLLVELSRNFLFSHLTFGLLQGWWLYEDKELRIPGSPGLSPGSWQEVLESEGFRWVTFPAQEVHDGGQQVIAAESDGTVRQPVPLTPPDQKNRTGASTETPAIHDAPDADLNRQVVLDQIKQTLIEKLSGSLKINTGMIDNNEPFADYGLDSIIGIQLVKDINRALAIELETIVLFDYSSVNKLAAHILSQYGEKIAAALGQHAASTAHPEKSREPNHAYPGSFPGQRSTGEAGAGKEQERPGAETGLRQGPIAIIGMSGRFARSKTVKDLWEHLAKGTDLVEKITRWHPSTYHPGEAVGKRDFCDYGSFLEDIDRFDPLFFNISGVEATYMEPQQRLFLEESWKALEDAGYAGDGMDGHRCGVYVGCSSADYVYLFGDQPPAQAFWGNSAAVIPARLAYHLNLRGPAVAIDTACSSSLVAIHLACQGLWTRETDLTLAGGVFIQCTPGFYLAANRAAMLSPSGRCYSFDQRANGFVPGEGVGAVVLKRLAEALADGDHIYGVIRGSAINQDGTTNGITAPSANSQEQLERFVYDTFHIHPQQIRMVEAHGTGTKLGDPIEYSALTRAFRKYTDKKEYCALGSIKTNIGHAATAAGIAGVIKILLALQHKQIPPSLHFQSGNENIRFKDSPFYVNTRLQDWPVDPNSRRCAAISSFGFSGTNAHMVIEEAPTVERHCPGKPGYLIALSARTVEQLRQRVEQLVDGCEREPGTPCGNISYTLLLGRKHFSHRLACVTPGTEQLVKLLKKWLEKGKDSQIYISEPHKKDQAEQPSLEGYGNQCLRDCLAIESPDRYLEQLAVIAGLYVQGYDLEYRQLFSNQGYSRISLPGYPFARESYWVPPQKKTGLIGQPADSPVTGPGELVVSYPETIPPTTRNLVDHLQRPEANSRLQRMRSEEAPKMKEFEGLVVKLLWEQLQSLGMFKQKNTRLTDLKKNAGLQDLYDRWLEESAVLLIRENYLHYDGQTYTVTDRGSSDVETGWNEWDSKKAAWLADPTRKSHAILLEATLRALPEILTGKQAATNVLFPNASIERVEGIYKNNPIVDYFNEILANTAAAYIQDRVAQDPSARIRILEIGAGTGGTSVTVFEKIRPYREHIQEYCYTDLSKVFLMHAKKEYGPGNPYLTYKIFNVEEPLSRQGLSAGGYDLVIAANVLHATKNLRQTVRHTKAALKKNGLLLLNEMADSSLYAHLTFGLLEGWWLYEDPELRIPGCPGLSPASWQKVLESEGFRWVSFPAQAVHNLGQQVVVAESDGIIRQKALLQPAGTSGEHVPGTATNQSRLSGKMSGLTPNQPNQEQQPLQGEKPVQTGAAATHPALEPHVKKTIMEKLAESLSIDINVIRVDEPFTAYGLDSIFGVQTVQAINRALAIELEPTILFSSGTVNQLTEYILSHHGEKLAAGWQQPGKPVIIGAVPPGIREKENKPGPAWLPGDGAAIVGMAAKFPGATELHEFWQNIVSAKVCIQPIPKQDWPWGDVGTDTEAAGLKTPQRWGGLLDEIEDFDPFIFGISPREAEMMDQQQRLLMTYTWKAMEDAGITAKSLANSHTGVFIAAAPGQPGHGASLSRDNPLLISAAIPSLIPNRISYTLNLRGPSEYCETACSSTLVALHRALQALRNRECEQALVGAVNLIRSPLGFVGLEAMGYLSPQGKTRPFQKEADGFVRGEGVGAVIIKPLARAIDDRDHIYAVIRGTGVSHGGKGHSLTAPNATGMEAAITQAFQAAALDPRSVSYIEAHGIASPQGDGIEINTLKSVYQELAAASRIDSPTVPRCYIGSLKPCIGHGEMVSGMSALIAIILAMHRQIIPGVPGFTTPSEHISLKDSPFQITAQNHPWEPLIDNEGKKLPRRAAINSYGLGGVNAHLLLEEYLPPQEKRVQPPSANSPEIVVFSAKNPEELRILVRHMLKFVQTQKELPLSDIAYTLQLGREAMASRVALLANNREELLRGLKAYLEPGKEKPNPGTPLPLFTGNGELAHPEIHRLLDGDLGETVKQVLLAENDPKKLALYWAKGGTLRWELLHQGNGCHRISLPTYPFAKGPGNTSKHKTPKDIPTVKKIGKKLRK